VLRIKPAAPQRYTVEVAATDAGAGVAAIYVYWNHSRTTASGAPQTVGGAATIVSPKLSKGTWFAHIRVLDRANRWSGWSHAGPYTAPQKFVSGTVTQGARCSTSVRGYFGFTRSHVLERCSSSATSAILRWRPY
jgi:O-glycosyl hydrolase